MRCFGCLWVGTVEWPIVWASREQMRRIDGCVPHRRWGLASTVVGVANQPVRYRSGDDDSARWLDFDLRAGDVVISARSKSGTTWVQMICALLIFDSPDLPRSLAELSPWLDWLVLSKEELFADLDRRTHRRFIKTHTPLDGLPDDDRVAFVVVARHPLDAAVSLYHQSDNLDRRRIAELTGQRNASAPRAQPPLEEWMGQWIRSDVSAQHALDSFNGVFHHLTGAWNRRDRPNVMLVHYADLLHDLPGEMRRIAAHLEIDVTSERIGELSRHATFESMRSRGADLAPDSVGVLIDKARFFRAGRSGAGTEALRREDLAAYNERSARVAPPDLLDWLHRG